MIIPVRFGLSTRVLRASLKERDNITAADLTFGGTAVTLNFRLTTSPFTVSNRAATIVNAALGKVSYQLLASDFTNLLFAGTQWFVWWSVSPIPNTSDTGVYSDGDFDILQVTQ